VGIAGGFIVLFLCFVGIAGGFIVLFLCFVGIVIVTITIIRPYACCHLPGYIYRLPGFARFFSWELLKKKVNKAGGWAACRKKKWRKKCWR